MAEPLKNIYFTEQSLNNFAEEITKVHPGFNKERFLKSIFNKDWESKELMARMHHVTECLHLCLPEDYITALKILLKIAGKAKSIEGMCLPDFVEKYGLDYWNESLEALIEFTKHSSSEFAIRPYIIKDKEKAMEYMLELSTSENEHVRRFSSEGCRPRLPWAQALPELKKDPSLIVPVLENLKADESEYVRKSVANNLNDISKDNPELVLDLCKKWQGKDKHTDWIIKKACRTLLKAGHPKAMVLFGYADANNYDVSGLSVNKESIQIGQDIEFSFALTSKNKEKAKTRIEYAVDYVKANGKTSAKVFMLKETEIAPGEHQLSKKHSFKERTTRKHYPGIHSVNIIINGEVKGSVDFELKK